MSATVSKHEALQDGQPGRATPDRHLPSCLPKAKEFVELHEQVETSVKLLDSLESFLSTFRKDLTTVSGQISELQSRSKDIDHRLKTRRRIEKPLSDLISDITIPPALATLILDTEVSEPWIEAIESFESKLERLKTRSRVKAARDLGEVAEGLRIVAAAKLRAFFLSLFQPIRSSVTTNMQVIQTSVLLKYRDLFLFLQRQVPAVAHELQRSYISAARAYYETGFRRYTRTLGWIKARTSEKFETLVAERDIDVSVELTRLRHAKIVGPGVTLSYMADDKTHKEHLEALFRSLLLVLMDNATAEYTFITTFFRASAAPASDEPKSSLLSPTALNGNMDGRSQAELDIDRQSPILDRGSIKSPGAVDKEVQSNLDGIWKQVIDPVLEYCQNFARSSIDPMPPVIPLLTMIRLTEDVIAEVQKRACRPLESFVFGLRLQMWPVFQKAMSQNIEVLKKLAQGGAGFFATGSTTTDVSVLNICQGYVVLFKSFVALTEQEEETMIFNNLIRLRQELTNLIIRHSEITTDPVAKATKQTTLFEKLFLGLSKEGQPSTHPKAQKEIAYWAEKAEETRRRIVSVSQGRNRNRGRT